MYYIYLLVNKDKRKTYTGFTNDIKRRIKEHRSKETKTTKNFGNFDYFILEQSEDLQKAVKREKYWKSCAGRKKIKKLFFS